MAQYMVHFFCDDCFQTHPTGIVMNLADGPPAKSSINDAYQGRSPPPGLLSMSNNTFPCPVTRKPTLQRTNDQVFLVPIG